MEAVREFIGEGRSGAVLSECRTYRYSLWRRWSDDEGRLCCFIGLNPSTADETEDDPTIRRCVGFAKRFGCVGLVMANLFAFRATHPEDMLAAIDPAGPENDQALKQIAAVCHPVICAWGVHGNRGYRDFRTKSMLRPLATLYHLGLTKGGHPKHPLYLKSDTELIKWESK